MKLRAVICLLALTASGCIVEEHHYSPPPPSDTRLEFDEMTNLGSVCGGPLTSWAVTNRQTGDSGAAGCEQPILFVGLAPGATYTFDIVGYNGQRVCWQGTCDAVAPGSTTSLVDCSGQIQHLCGF